MLDGKIEEVGQRILAETMVSFGFILTSSMDKEERISPYLRDIDTELREKMGLPPDADNYCEEYHCLTWLGIAVCARSTTGRATTEEFDRIMVDNTVRSPEELAVYKDFICGKYTFWAMR